MTDILLLLLGAVLVNHFVLTQFLGLCPSMGLSGKLESNIGMAAVTTFVLTLASLCGYLVYHYLLVPFELVFLRTIAFILVTAVVVGFTVMALHKVNPALHKVLGILLPLLITNCAVLGVALFNTERANTLLEAAFYGFGIALGFSLALVLFSALQERLAIGDVPEPFQGAAIAMINAGLMALAFMGFAGLV